MRYPVNNWHLWYDAQPFGKKTVYGYHDGADINLRTGGNTDLGQPLFAISDGVVTHVEFLTTGFGHNLHIKHTGPWGTVWSHFAHCRNILVKVGDTVKEGQQVAEVGHTGNSRDSQGNPVAHCHWAIKLQPTGIGNIANTQEELKMWTDPIVFVQKWMKGATSPSMPEKVYTEEFVTQLRLERDNNHNLYQEAAREVTLLKEKYIQYDQIVNTMNAYKGQVDSLFSYLKKLAQAPEDEDDLEKVKGVIETRLQNEEKLDEELRKVNQAKSKMEEDHIREVKELKDDIVQLRLDVEKQQRENENLLLRLNNIEKQADQTKKNKEYIQVINWIYDSAKKLFERKYDKKSK